MQIQSVMQFFLKAIVALAATCNAAPLDGEQYGVVKATTNAVVPTGMPLVANVEMTNVHIRKLSETAPRQYSTNGQGHNIQVALGNYKTHVGDLTGPDLYHNIWHALDGLCPAGSDKCTKKSDSSPTVRKIEIKTLDGKIIKTTTSGALEISVEESNYGNNDALRRLIIGTVAAAFQKETEITTNCYNESYGARNKQKISFCNVGDFVAVNIKDTQNFMNVKIKSIAPYGGKFDCVGGITFINGAVDDLIPEYKKALGVDQVTKNVFCLDMGITRTD